MGKMEEACKVSYYVIPEDVEGTQDIRGNTSDNYTKVEMPFNSLMTG